MRREDDSMRPILLLLSANERESEQNKSSPFYCIDHKLSALLMHFMMMFVRFDSTVGLFIFSLSLKLTTFISRFA